VTSCNAVQRRKFAAAKLIYIRAGSISPLSISIFSDISDSRISAISIFFTEAAYLYFEKLKKCLTFFVFDFGGPTAPSL